MTMIGYFGKKFNVSFVGNNFNHKKGKERDEVKLENHSHKI